MLGLTPFNMFSRLCCCHCVFRCVSHHLLNKHLMSFPPTQPGAGRWISLSDRPGSHSLPQIGQVPSFSPTSPTPGHQVSGVGSQWTPISSESGPWNLIRCSRLLAEQGGSPTRLGFCPRGLGLPRALVGGRGDASGAPRQSKTCWGK